MLSEILTKNKELYTLQINELISHRLAYFKNQGMQANLYYNSKVNQTAKLAMKECDLNRVLFNILAFINHHNTRLKVEVKNDSRFLRLSFSCIGSRFPSRQKGFFLLSPQNLRKGHKKTYLNSVSTLVRESGGHLHYSKTSSCEWCLDLQIPLSPHFIEYNDFPHLRENKKDIFVSLKAPLKEGVFFRHFLNRYFYRLEAL